MSTNAPAVPDLAPEDEGRAQFYALLARLFAAGPDESLLRALSQSAGSIEGDGALAGAWNDLVVAATNTSSRDATLEFDTTFVGVGKAPVTTYLSHYQSVVHKERLLVDLRTDLARLGLARTVSSAEPEDNLASVLEVMRHLATAGSDRQSLQRQREFYSRYLAPAYRDFCDAAHKAGLSEFYQTAVRVFDAFMSAEQVQFEMAELGMVEPRR